MIFLKRSKRKYFRHHLQGQPFFTASIVGARNSEFRIKNLSKGGISIIWSDTIAHNEPRQLAMTLVDFNLAQQSILVGVECSESRYKFTDTGNPTIIHVLDLMDFGRKAIKKGRNSKVPNNYGNLFTIEHKFTLFEFQTDSKGALVSARLRIKIENKKLGFLVSSHQLRCINLDNIHLEIAKTLELSRYSNALLAVLIGVKSKYDSYILMTTIAWLTNHINQLNSLKLKGIKEA